MSIFRVFLLVAVGSLLLAVGCSSQNYVRESLEQHQKQWQGQNIKDYRYQFQALCFCPTAVTDPVIIEVKGGASASVTYVDSGQPAEIKYFEKYDTIDELFAFIDDALDRKADEVTVSYNEALGYPVRIYIDYAKNAIDDELTLSISNLQVVR